MTYISAIIPCYNEEENVLRAYQQIKESLETLGSFEMIFIDDGSTDRTLSTIKAIAGRDQRVRYISFSRNCGLEAAFTAGFRFASGHWTMQFDCDLQSPPEEAPRLLAKAIEGFDAVFAIREDRQDHWCRRLGSKTQQWIARRVLNIQMPAGASVFRIVRTSVAQSALNYHSGPKYFLASLPMVTSRYTTIRTKHNHRLAGDSKWSSLKLAAHSMELFFGYSSRLINFAICGFLVAATSAGFGATHIATASMALSFAVVLPYLKRLLQQTYGQGSYLIREANLEIVDTEPLLAKTYNTAALTGEQTQ